MILKQDIQIIKAEGEMPEYVRIKGGSKTLVVIPGLSVRKVTEDAAILANKFRIYLKTHTVYVVERPDFIPDGCTNEYLAENLYSLLKSLGLHKVDVLGCSQGGMIAQYLAVNHPDTVRHLVLAATLSKPNDTFRHVISLWQKMAEENRFYELNLDFINHAFSRGFVTDNMKALTEYAKLYLPDDNERFIRLCKACSSCSPTGKLSLIKCPTLVIGSENDTIVTSEASRELASEIGCGLYMYSQFNHAFYDEAGDDFTERVSDFINH